MTPDRPPRDVVSQEESTEGQEKSKPRGRNRGHGPRDWDNLRIVLDLLLDLADEGAKEGWEEVQRNHPKTYADLRRALVVRWDLDRIGNLLVTSTRKDPDAKRSKNKPIEKSNTTTLEAIRQVLDATGRRLNLKGRGADTPEKSFTIDRIRNALDGLKDLQIRRDTVKYFYDGFWSFRLVFPSDCEGRKQDCLAYVEAEWEKKWSGANDAEAGYDPNQDPLQLARTKERLRSLDQWVNRHLGGWRQRFEAREEVRERRIHVPLTTAIRLSMADADAAEMPSVIRELAPEDIQSVVAQKGSQMLMIWEEGGAGKTSLALEIARWGLAGQLAGHVMLPILLDLTSSKGDLVERVRDQLIHLDRSIRVDQVRDLLNHRRLLVIVDHFSECTMAQRQWLIEHCHPQEIDLVLLTSRQHEGSHFQGWLISAIQPQRLQNEALFSFFRDYLVERSKQVATTKFTSQLLSPEDQVRVRDLLERMVGNRPITVLLAWMVIEKAIEHIQNGMVDLLPDSVPELMIAYVERSSKAIPLNNQYLEGEPKTPVDSALIETSLKALALAAHEHDFAYKPQNFDLALAQRALANVCINDEGMQTDSQARRLLRYLHRKTNLLQRQGGSEAYPIYRISLDPMADYLAALALIEKLTTPTSPGEQLRALQSWLGQLSGQLELGDRDSRSLMRGFLSACRDVSKNWLTRLPDGLDPSLREQWNQIPHRFAQLAGIDPLEERQLEARHLIRRHAGDLAWANPELRPKALAELSAYAREFAGSTQLGELEEAVDPVKNTLLKTSLPARDRAAAAEALGLIGSQKAADALERTIGNDHEPSVAVRRAAAEALGLIAAVGSNRQRHWDLLETMLTAASLQDETDLERISAVLPLLQGASRGLQRLACRHLPRWGSDDRFDVPMLTLKTAAGALTTKVVRIPVWQVPLPGGLCLELVEVPGCIHEIGSPEGEVGHEHYKHMLEIQEVNLGEDLRTVSLHGFLLARYPLTQAQWRSLVDSRYAIRHKLAPDPAQYKGADLPVESVNWYDASEWCARLENYLSQEMALLSLKVSLPSESQWEVACRAGVTAPFHFGDTIDATWANYDGNYTYSSGRNGAYLNRTSAVGAYGLVNNFGLADLHGNVWEWCQDIWRPSHLDETKDGSTQFPQPLDLWENRLLRGGSWFDVPLNCRAACRFSYVPAGVSNQFGFRPSFTPAV